MGKLILVRHGHTALNKPGEDERLRAWLDVPLDETGMREVVDTAEKLHGYPIEAIYCSDLKREWFSSTRWSPPIPVCPSAA